MGNGSGFTHDECVNTLGNKCRPNLECWVMQWMVMQLVLFLLHTPFCPSYEPQVRMVWLSFRRGSLSLGGRLMCVRMGGLSKSISLPFLYIASCPHPPEKWEKGLVFWMTFLVTWGGVKWHKECNYCITHALHAYLILCLIAYVIAYN